MKLITKALEREFAIQGDTSEMDPECIKIIAKFFDPMGIAKWYATEYDPERRVFFGFVSLFDDCCDELGYFSLDALASAGTRLPVERDRCFGDHSLAEVMNGARP